MTKKRRKLLGDNQKKEVESKAQETIVNSTPKKKPKRRNFFSGKQSQERKLRQYERKPHRFRSLRDPESIRQAHKRVCNLLLNDRITPAVANSLCSHLNALRQSMETELFMTHLEQLQELENFLGALDITPSDALPVSSAQLPEKETVNV